MLPWFAKQRSRLGQFWPVARKLWRQSWLGVVGAVLYASWDTYSAPPGAHLTSSWVKSFGGALFLIMWFLNQWVRTSKQLSDSAQLTSIQSTVERVAAEMAAGRESRSPERGEPPIVVQTPPSASASAQAEANVVLGPVEQTASITARSSSQDPVASILEELPRSAHGALARVGGEIERELRALLFSSGWHSPAGRGPLSITSAVRRLQELDVVPKALGDSVRVFLDIRNRLLHGHGVRDDEIPRAVKVGIEILEVVRAVPREVHTVIRGGIPLFSDAELRHQIDAVGVLLDNVHSNLGRTSRSIHPTLSTEYRPGAVVSWEWSFEPTFGPVWYRDVDTGKVVQPWQSSALFVGREIDYIF